MFTVACSSSPDHAASLISIWILCGCSAAVSTVAAIYLLRPINYYLRRVDAFEMEAVVVIVLPLRPVWRRKWVTPPLVVPVVDMLAQHDHRDAVIGLVTIERCKQVICRRTAGAAFRCE